MPFGDYSSRNQASEVFCGAPSGVPCAYVTSPVDAQGQADVSDCDGGKDEGSSHAPGDDTGSKDIDNEGSSLV